MPGSVHSGSASWDDWVAMWSGVEHTQSMTHYMDIYSSRCTEYHTFSHTGTHDMLLQNPKMTFVISDKGIKAVWISCACVTNAVHRMRRAKYWHNFKGVRAETGESSLCKS